MSETQVLTLAVVAVGLLLSDRKDEVVVAMQ